MYSFITKLAKTPKKLFTPTLNGEGQGNWLLRVICLWLMTGGVYFVIEGIWRIHTNGGWANIAMAPIGGFCGVLIAIMNENPKFTSKKMYVRCLYGMAALIVVEFVSGYIMNIILGMDIWDYSGLPMNFMGQICLPFAILWYLFTPFILWYDDLLRYKFWNDGEKYPWYINYVKLFTLK